MVGANKHLSGPSDSYHSEKKITGNIQYAPKNPEKASLLLEQYRLRPEHFECASHCTQPGWRVQINT